MIVRPGRDTDLDALVPLVREFCEIDGHPYDETHVRDALGPLLASDRHGIVWLALHDDGLAGYAVVTWGYSLESGGRDALLDELYVRVRGNGVGGALMEALLAECTARGLRRMFLETETGNDGARRFYRSLGFDEEDSIWMSRTL
jgi:GNAT superfamily N-acetyltransferase